MTFKWGCNNVHDTTRQGGRPWNLEIFLELLLVNSAKFGCFTQKELTNFEEHAADVLKSHKKVVIQPTPREKSRPEERGDRDIMW
jgi:hypothetical protein